MRVHGVWADGYARAFGCGLGAGSGVASVFDSVSCSPFRGGGWVAVTDGVMVGRGFRWAIRGGVVMGGLLCWAHMARISWGVMCKFVSYFSHLLHYQCGPEAPDLADAICRLIHAYFVAKQIKDHLTPGMRYPMSCPQCQNVAFSFGPLSTVPFSLGGYKFAPAWKQEYTPLLNEESQEEGVGRENGDEVAEAV